MEATVRLISISLVLSAAATIGSIPDAARASTASRILPADEAQARPIAYHCWSAYGQRHCRWVGGNRIYRYGAGSPDEYPVGTAEWYRAMERDGRLNRPRR
jgi:hypothetical protein